MPARPAVSVRTEQAEDCVRAENEGNDALNCDGARVAELARRLTLGLTRETCPRSYLVEEPSDGSQVRFEADASSGPSGNSSPTMVVSFEPSVRLVYWETAEPTRCGPAQLSRSRRTTAATRRGLVPQTPERGRLLSGARSSVVPAPRALSAWRS